MDSQWVCVLVSNPLWRGWIEHIYILQLCWACCFVLFCLVEFFFVLSFSLSLSRNFSIVQHAGWFSVWPNIRTHTIGFWPIENNWHAFKKYCSVNCDANKKWATDTREHLKRCKQVVAWCYSAWFHVVEKLCKTMVNQSIGEWVLWRYRSHERWWWWLTLEALFTEWRM